jgi:hypothetical protein
MKKWWVTIYGAWGNTFMPLEDCDKETLMDMLTGVIQNYKLEKLSQEERNSIEMKREQVR